jgi:hypothetical protein
MKQITLQIPDKKFPFFMELLKNLGLEKKARVAQEEKEPSKQEILQGIREAAEEVKLAKQGKVKLKSFESFLNEL